MVQRPIYFQLLFLAPSLGTGKALYESARTWAYREIRNHWGDPDSLRRSIQTVAQAIDVEMFTEPLPTNEVDHIARSIHKWIITKSRMWADGPATRGSCSAWRRITRWWITSAPGRGLSRSLSRCRRAHIVPAPARTWSHVTAYDLPCF
ncbi:primase C-terminal domain-containing protein [Corynebacterium lujinxingii]|uniref:Primase C-terminal domain-containing protein n=1 Tax=Corynebacterium lujinxingii TaxID=2763010 RepID=A0A7H0K1S6_9CORY|nr:primase C-terminal domain-containing protein [Corynebacterium lujinxingii]NNO10996.1 hypothetical protein [Corynebacterium lujinxingii]QNP91242.1 primase C-terminal domain-containing protein [Corynebacterium lujinxingii]